MNLIYCSSNCRYQEDGLCKLGGPLQVVNQAGAGKGCVFFTEKAKDEKKSGRTPLQENDKK